MAIPTGETVDLDSGSSSESDSEEQQGKGRPVMGGHALLSHLFFVLLRPAQEAPKAQRPTPFPGLRLGPVLGSGKPPSATSVHINGLRVAELLPAPFML